MKALFVTENAHYHYSEPIGLMQLVSVLQQAGHEARIEIDRYERLARHVREWKPDLVGYSVGTRGCQAALALNRRLKQVGPFFSIMGGPHATFFPDVIADDGLDAICRGEGEGAMLDLANALDRGAPVEGIANLWVRGADGTLHKNPVRPLIEDLDSLPFPDRESFYRLFPRHEVYGVLRFAASRGCPYNCTYCFNHAYYEMYRDKGTRVRWRSPENVVAEVEEAMARFPFKMAAFGDDCFPYGENWLARFCDAYVKRVGVPWICHLRPERVTPERARLLKEAGCHAVMIGVEHGSEELRREMLHRYMDNDEILDAARALNGAGVRVFSTNMVGIPGETLETAFETLDLNLALGLIQTSAFFYQPFPGTELCAMAREAGVYEAEDGAVEIGDYSSSSDAWKIPDKTRLLRMRALIPIVVHFPFLRPLVPALANLPFLPLYNGIHRLSVGYTTKFRLFPVPMRPGHFFRMLFRYLREDPF